RAMKALTSKSRVRSFRSSTRRSLLRSWRQMFQEIAGDQLIHVRRRSGAFGDRVRPIGIHHQIEWFAELDEPVDQPLGALIVDVVVAGPVDDQQLAFPA